MFDDVFRGREISLATSISYVGTLHRTSHEERNQSTVMQPRMIRSQNAGVIKLTYQDIFVTDCGMISRGPDIYFLSYQLSSILMYMYISQLKKQAMK